MMNEEQIHEAASANIAKRRALIDMMAAVRCSNSPEHEELWERLRGRCTELEGEFNAYMRILRG